MDLLRNGRIRVSPGAVGAFLGGPKAFRAPGRIAACRRPGCLA